MKKYKFLKICTAILLLAVATATALSMRKNKTEGKLLPAPVKSSPQIFLQRTADPALVRRLDSVLNTLKMDIPELTIAGNAVMVDPKETALSGHRLPFVFAKKDGDYYYRFGNDESINSQGRFISINRDTRTVFTAKQKKLAGLNILDSKQLQAMINDGGFGLTVVQEGTMMIYTLVSDTNLMCRLYQIGFDTQKQQVGFIETVMPDAGQPENRKLDRSVKISLATVARFAKLSGYPRIADVIDENGRLKEGFTAFKLIRF
ncbi:MAG: hypothetical protein V4456_07675 [Bacteroidota bacterium]